MQMQMYLIDNELVPCIIIPRHYYSNNHQKTKLKIDSKQCNCVLSIISRIKSHFRISFFSVETSYET